MRRDLGDFQTPPELAAAVLRALGPIGERWPRVLEPTCGRGEFLAAALASPVPPRELRGIEIQESYCQDARVRVAGCDGTHVEVVHSSLFELDLRRELPWKASGPLLVVGNPPWVTNATLGALGSGNHPRKTNVKRLGGMAARTGASNFDIAEAVWLKLIEEFAGEDVTIALLCKRSVARSVLQFVARSGLPVREASLRRIDARRWFGASVDACLFGLTLGSGAPLVRVPVFASLEASDPESYVGITNGRLVADLDAYLPRAFADGRCPLTWRQGLKHDAAAVMELLRDPGSFVLRNKHGVEVDVEPDWAYPLIKGADLLSPRLPEPRRTVIVTQRRIGQDTRPLELTAPRLWAYLSANGDALAGRKSSIYRGQPPFAMFGLGPYSFAPYKVAVSGLAKVPRFHLVGPVDGRPAMLDDTCYFIPCRSAEQAAISTALLNHPETMAFVRSLIFGDAKRPVTKAILDRIDLNAIAARIDLSLIVERAGDELERLDSQPVACPEFPAEPPRCSVA